MMDNVLLTPQISSAEDYALALDRAFALMDAEKNSRNGAELNSLADQIADYEGRNFTFGDGVSPK
ncbi:MAG: hypothetical protein QM537_05570 [Candidatus Symbiobacter sp.]|nr:hypothetical protein [Candidatus Symbiobacter sp.]